MTDVASAHIAAGISRSDQLDRTIHALLAQTPELEAAAVVSFDGLPMAAALPPSMDEDRVAAMSAAMLSLGERAAQGLGRGELSQVYIEGDAGTVFLVSCEDEAVLVAVAAKGAKVGMMLYEVRRAALTVATVLRAEDDEPAEPAAVTEPEPEPVAVPAPSYAAPVAPISAAPSYSAPTYSAPAPADPVPAEPTYAAPTYAPPPYAAPTYSAPEAGFAHGADPLTDALPDTGAAQPDTTWTPSYVANGTVTPGGTPPSTWS